MTAPTPQTCAQCEYFDAHYRDCGSSHSDRFQTEAESAACVSFYPDTTGRDDEVSQ